MMSSTEAWPRRATNGGWKNIPDIKSAIDKYIDQFNHRRLQSEIKLTTNAEPKVHYGKSNTPQHYTKLLVFTQVATINWSLH